MKLISIILIYMIVNNLDAQDEAVNSLFADYSDSCPGASILVCRDGKIIFNSFLGFANLETKTKTDSKTNFRLASVTKQFTAAAVLILVQRGLLSLDAKLTQIFQEFPAYGKKITIKNLLNHTSGLIDYEDLIPDSATAQVKDADVLRMMMAQNETYFEPGTQHKYSNTGYALLALIVEKISGKSFAQFLNENIFKPLEMKNTVAHEEGISVVKNRAYGYSRKDSGWVRKDQSVTSAVLGDGGIYSNVDDLYKWDQSLFSDKILTDKLRIEAMTQAVLNNGEKVDYGYGWHLKIYKNEKVVYHTGSTQGFRNVIYRVPSQKFTVIILTNRNEGDPGKIADKIFELYLSMSK